MDCVVNIICETLNGSSTLPVYHCLSYFRQIDLKQKQHGFLQDWKYFLSKKSVLTSIKRISANLYQTIIVHLPNICLYKLLASFYKESGKLLTVVTYCPKPPRNILTVVSSPNHNKRVPTNQRALLRFSTSNISSCGRGGARWLLRMLCFCSNLLI